MLCLQDFMVLKKMLNSIRIQAKKVLEAIDKTDTIHQKTEAEIADLLRVMAYPGLLFSIEIEKNGVNGMAGCTASVLFQLKLLTI
jgi:hypothetical protein